MRTACAAAFAALVLPGAAAACPVRATPDPPVPGWQATNGFTLGSRAATPAEIGRYLRAVDRASPRVQGFVAGRSIEGRPLRYVAVSTPGNLARLRRTAADLRAVRSGRLRGSRVSAVVRRRPLFAWVGASVHGNEPSGGDAQMRLLHDLATGRSCADARRLRRLVVFLMPLQNPDGRHAGTRVNADGFDLNRDWFARTQPETRATIAALSRFPPVVFADQHEQGGSGFFFPPNADPVHHEISAPALRAINRVVAPALRRSFRRHDVPFTNYDTYDLFFMGFGDSATTTLYGAAGLTFEKGGSSPYPVKTAEQHLAAGATLGAAAARRRELLEGWARQWRTARAQGARGALQPNRVVEPGNSVRFAVPDREVHGHVFWGGDAPTLAHRLASVGVRVLRLADEAPVPALRGYGAAASSPATVPGGAYHVPMEQPAKHWVQALLGDDAHTPVPYFYDVSSWSNPLLMGLAGGALGAPLHLPAQGETMVGAGERPAAPGPGAAHRFAGGAEASVELAFALLRAGADVHRGADGSFVTTAGAAAVAPAAVARRVAVEALPEDPGGTPLRLPAVAILEDPAAGSSAAWARWLLVRRYGLQPTPLTGADLAAGALARHDVLVVPDGTSAPADLPARGLAALQAWVSAGGTLLGWRARGIAVARAAAVTAVTVAPPPPGLQVPGVALRVSLDAADPVAAGEAPESYVFNAGDPILRAHGAPVVARYPRDERFFVSGYATGTDALRGTPAATHETVGAGGVVLFGFDPVFRGYVEATERLVGNVLLAPRPAQATTRRRPAPRAVQPSALALAPSGGDATVQVAAADEAALLEAAGRAGVPQSFTLEHDLSTVTLRVPGARDLQAAERPWVRRLAAALRAAGVRPLLAIL